MDVVVDCALGRELTPEEIAALPPEPAPTLEEAKARLWESVKAVRDRHIDAGVPVPGIGTFDSDLVSRTNISGSVTGAMIAQANSLPFSVSWKLADNSIVTLNAGQMIAAGMAVLEHVAACHAIAQVLGLAIQAAEDHAALDAIDMEAGWP